jgi:hypothetical protein
MSAALLTFTAEGHEYRRADGVLVPSVTEILRATGVSTDFDALMAMSATKREQIERARALGTAVHADTHALDDDDLDLTQVHQEVLPYVQAWATFRQNKGLFPTTRERIVYSPSLGVCGTLDGIFSRHEDAERRILIDIKTGDLESAGTQFQTAAYELLWMAEHPDLPIAERWGVRLAPELTVPYRVEKYDDWTDGAKFRAFVTTYFCQSARRTRRT